MSLEDRIKSEQQAMKPIKNADIICKDCVYAYDDTKIPGNISHCEMYKDKWTLIVKLVVSKTLTFCCNHSGCQMLLRT